MLQLLWPSLFLSLSFLVLSLFLFSLPAFKCFTSSVVTRLSRLIKVFRRCKQVAQKNVSKHRASPSTLCIWPSLRPPRYFPSVAFFYYIFPSFNVRGKTAGDESTQQLVHFHSQPQLLYFSHNQANLWKSNYGSLVSQDPFFRNRET
ncbi:hypothetical protein MRX96_016660 [Rhipicephalus microplus]